MFTNANARPYQTGDLFLGLDQNNREIGVSTDRHAITIAGSRTGKGATAIIPNLLRWPHNVLVIDPKGENAEHTWQARQAMGSKVYVLDPFETANVPAHLRASFNPLEGIDPDSLTGSADLEVIADGLVKRSDPKHAQWDDGAVTLLAGLMAYVLTVGAEDARTLKSVRDILLLDRDDLYAEAQEMKQCEAFDGIAQDAGSIIMGAFENEKGMESDILTASRRHIKWINIRAMRNVLEESSFALSKLKNGKASVYVVLPPEYLKSHSAFLRLFTLMAINAMAKGGSGRGEKCLFVLDEFYSLGKMESVSNSAGLMPSYGVHLWPILQDLGQLIERYGNEGSQTFFANADLQQFFGVSDSLTLELISKQLGTVALDEIQDAPNAPIITPNTPTQPNPNRLPSVFDNLDGIFDAARQSSYQNKMTEYQRDASRYGKPRKTPDEIAKIIGRSTDVIADKMICFVKGAEPLLLNPAPYFRTLPKPQQQQRQQPTQTMGASQPTTFTEDLKSFAPYSELPLIVRVLAICTLIFSGFGALVFLIAVLGGAPTIGQVLALFLHGGVASCLIWYMRA